MSQSADSKNVRTALVAAAVAVGMVGVSFAAVPLYAAFCQATGFAGTTQVAEKASGQRGLRTFKVRFNANVAPGLDWRFEPESESVEVRTGATATVFFRFHNNADHETFARAVYNVNPEVSGAWFDKVSCFCFTEQRLGPHEDAELPVVFFLDPKLEKDHDMDPVSEITLSYTLFAAPEAQKPVAFARPSESAAPKL